ncbi:MAG: hypothetical protein ACI9F9_002706 [Candidatus Paceibacteria bacterium]|jgi:hypothetical protein
MPRSFSRRAALRAAALGLGWLGMPSSASASRSLPPAKRVIFLCMAGGPSHVDTFDYKPQLAKSNGKDAPGDYRRGAKLLGSPFKFKQHGQSGLWISELFPHLAEQADRLCMLHGMHTDIPAHSQAFIRMHTGTSQFVRPSMGAWVHYGLGTANENLPAFVTLNPPSTQGGAQNYGSAILPQQHQGLRIGIERESRLTRRNKPDEAVADIKNPRRTDKAQRRQLDLLDALNKAHAKKGDANGAIGSVNEAYELAFKMQAELPALLDTSSVPRKTLAMYGIGEETTDNFGRQCLTARNLAAEGVRFIEINQGGWDHHRNLKADLRTSCDAIDLPIAALLQDLDRSGLLEDTLVVWGGEFGRTPFAQGTDGRDHNNRGYTTWMAGAGVRPGFSYGQTDEVGIEAVEGRVSTNDWHATILHLLGLEHESLTFNHAGREFRLTDVAGDVLRGILA